MKCVSRLHGIMNKEKVINFYDKMAEKYDVKIIEKKDSPLMIIVSWVFGFLRCFMNSVPNRREFMNDYSTTLRNRFYIRTYVGNETEISYRNYIYLLLHEFEHVLQFRESFTMPFKYVLSGKKRAMYEAKACSTHLIYAWKYDYSCPTDDKQNIFLAWILRKGETWKDSYDCSYDDVEDAKRYLENIIVNLSHDEDKVNHELVTFARTILERKV